MHIKLQDEVEAANDKVKILEMEKNSETVSDRVGSNTEKRTGGRRKTCKELGRNVARSGRHKRMAR